MQPWSVSKTPALHAQKPFAKQKSTEILQRLKSPKSWRFISNLLEVNLVNLALQTEAKLVVSNIFYFHPQNWKRFPFCGAYFSDGLVQPPRKELQLMDDRNDGNMR